MNPFEYMHPVLAGFPFPLFVAAFLTEIVAYFGITNNWRAHSCFLVIIGSLFSLAAYYSGFYQLDSASISFVVDPEIIAHHQNVGRMQLMSLIPLNLFAVIRSLKPNEFLHWLFVPFLILTLLLTASASHKGGTLVFKHGAGVSRECSDVDKSAGEQAKVLQDKLDNKK